MTFIRVLLFLIPTIILLSCQETTTTEVSTTDKIEVPKDSLYALIYGTEKIQAQNFVFDAGKDTTFTGKNGTMVRVYANSFINQNGKVHTGKVNFELKEAVTRIDMVMGNLTTTSNNKILESDGMVFLGASAEGNPLALAEGSEIGVALPTESVDKEMQVFEGKKEGNTIDWVQPKAPENENLQRLEKSFRWCYYQSYHKEGYYTLYDSLFVGERATAIDNFFWRSNSKPGDRIKMDSIEIEIIKYETNTVAIKESTNGLFYQDVFTNKGVNSFASDYNTQYLFSAKKLGWANIDKFFSDPKTGNMEMITKVTDHDNFDVVFITMIMKDRDAYIPGYQKKDNSFGFAHSDSELCKLPIGDKAIILATAYKGEQPYFGTTEVVLDSEGEITVDLNECKPEEFKERIASSI